LGQVTKAAGIKVF